MAFPWNVVPVKPQRVAWAYFTLLFVGFLVYSSFLSYKAYALSQTPVVAIRYDRVSPLQLPYVAMCFNDLDNSQVGFTVTSPNPKPNVNPSSPDQKYEDSPVRCIVTGGSPVDPARFEALNGTRKLPRQSRIKQQLDTSTSCQPPGGIGLERRNPINITYAEKPSCEIETFQFTNRGGSCADCFGFPLSDYQIEPNGSASIYLKLVATCEKGPNDRDPCSFPVGVYLIEPEDVPLARSNRFDEVISRTTSIAAALKTSYRVVLKNRVTFQYTALGSRRSSQFREPAVREIAVEDDNATVTYTDPKIQYVALEILPDGYGVEIIEQVNPWLALPSSIGGAWNLVTLAFGLLFVSAIPQSGAPSLTWVNREWFAREVWGPVKETLQQSTTNPSCKMRRWREPEGGLVCD
ncbi:hypothetical protein KFL_001660135 [Klebsormidium nitens]|uniref:Uncharacterized protein n=1 Tax=Klebsormidium nitens TaxID=105231 RepID=A0A1Y1I6Z4_KLENI|nr:hypothetical protein KFL_001660135 [Klebsormidium nitens]|eukprot:GAQ83878.1 hypothetical protein KFL_001660135 [Klebsormidium nitens]